LDENAIREFWQANPCGQHFVSEPLSVARAEEFFREYDQFRYRLERHIPSCLDAIGVANKDLLEIGLGQGADSEQLARRGARWNGLDLTQAAVDRVRLRFQLRGLGLGDCRVGSALAIPWPDQSFDIVFSHGVLHHIPNILQAQGEIARVLRPGGRLVIMMYAKHSLNYWVSIALVRRLGLLAMRALRIEGSGIYRRHYELSQQIGLRRYLRLGNFIHRSTDGPDNVYSKVYTRKLLQRDFPQFEVGKTFKRFLYAPPLPIANLSSGSILGWHLWAELRKRP
jgi:SAM-dependent methyltransferase